MTCGAAEWLFAGIPLYNGVLVQRDALFRAEVVVEHA
jgi:hypothetical protein